MYRGPYHQEVLRCLVCGKLETDICQGGMFQAVKRIFTTSVWWFWTFLHFWYSTKNGKWSNVTFSFQMGWDHQLVYFWCLQPAGLKTKTSPPIPIKRCYVLRGLAHDTKITVPWRTSVQFWFWNRGFAIFRIKPKIWFWIVLYIFEHSNLQSYSLSVGLSQNYWDIHIALGVFLEGE